MTKNTLSDIYTNNIGGSPLGSKTTNLTIIPSTVDKNLLPKGMKRNVFVTDEVSTINVDNNYVINIPQLTGLYAHCDFYFILDGVLFNPATVITSSNKVCGVMSSFPGDGKLYISMGKDYMTTSLQGTFVPEGILEAPTSSDQWAIVLTYSGDRDDTPTLTEYTTEEQVVGKWIDGRPIYRKVTSGKLAANLKVTQTGGTIDQFLSVQGWVQHPTNKNQYFPYSYGSQNGYYFILSSSTHEISVTLYGSTYSGTPFVVIVEYTKSTDLVTE